MASILALTIGLVLYSCSKLIKVEKIKSGKSIIVQDSPIKEWLYTIGAIFVFGGGLGIVSILFFELTYRGTKLLGY